MSCSWWLPRSLSATLLRLAGIEISRSFSREGDPLDHAEESALRKLPADDARLAKATLYSSLEPCSVRKSRPTSCTKLILDAGIRRVVFAWREPELFVDCQGAKILREAGVEVLEIPDFARLVQQINGHLLDRA